MIIKFSCFNAIDGKRYKERKFWLMSSVLLPFWLFVAVISLGMVFGLGFMTFLFIVSIKELLSNLLALLAFGLILVGGWAIVSFAFYGFTATIFYRLFGYTIITFDSDTYSFEMRIGKFKASSKGITKNIRSVKAIEGYATTSHIYYVACCIEETKISKHELIGLNYAEAKWIAAEILDYLDSVNATK